MPSNPWVTIRKPEDGFVSERPHSDVMTALQGKMGETRFIQWKMVGLQYPPSWHDAFKHR